MHVNRNKSNILQDMTAAAQGRDLHNPMAKRWLVPRKVYPYSNERQDGRPRRAYARCVAKSSTIPAKGASNAKG